MNGTQKRYNGSMTAEIVIMNLEAVAVAADSAVTISHGDDRKIFSSQNKLFALSEIAPVGIVIYGSARFMSIPWETLIKEYRRRLGTKLFPRLGDYEDDFCRFLTNDVVKLISPEQQTAHGEGLVGSIYHEIEELIQDRVIERLAGSETDDVGGDSGQIDELLESITEDTIKHFASVAEETELVEGLPSNYLIELPRKLQGVLEELRGEVFQRDLSEEIVEQLNAIASRALGGMLHETFEGPSSLTAGVAIVGFGEDDLFPSFTEFHVEGLIGNILKKQEGRSGATGPRRRAGIIPLAQDDVVYQFMKGIAPEHMEYLQESVVSHLRDYLEFLLSRVTQLSADDKEELRAVLTESHVPIAEEFLNQLDEFGDSVFANEIMDVVAMLPKEQLAEMAEALVNLTSLRRKVSLQDETVGGPIDVALITKGDGLIWMKRKHYFSAETNPAFFARKYRRP